MIKVKEYLDKYLHSIEPSTATLKLNGHYCVTGRWEYPKGISESEGIRCKEYYEKCTSLQNWFPKDQMSFSCNNETLSIRMIFCNGENLTTYSYLQTYEHIPRGEPDRNGYYRRCTDEEIIRFIDERRKLIIKQDREIKLKRICK